MVNASTNGGPQLNGHHHHDEFFRGRAHPQTSFVETVVEPSSFFGQLRALYYNTVLKTQLEQMRKSGAYDGFSLKWKKVYDIRRIHEGKWRPDGAPPLIFQECDISTWIEAVCYFLNSPDGKSSPHRAEFEACLDETVSRIEKAQQPDGYLGIYFTVVDPKGRFMNLRDFHELYEAGHLIEAALAHHALTGSTKFLDVMVRYVDLLMKTFGPEPGQLHGYCGHPELELAMMRLYGVTHDPRHLAFARYQLEERGQRRADQDGDTFFEWEARSRRKDLTCGSQMQDWRDMVYFQAHAPLHEQEHILGHSVRALYLTTAAADAGGLLLKDAKRLLNDAIDNKMYVTGGVGSEPRTEGFSPYPHHLPHSKQEGGGYNETCASIAVMMTCERVLSHSLNGKFRDILELCLFNNVLGGGSLDGKGFAYENRLATCDDETAFRQPWFETACCPPNLARTLGMIGGYTWNAVTHPDTKVIKLSVYLYNSATRSIPLPGGEKAIVKMVTEMPWVGNTKWELSAPPGWTWELSVPEPNYARNSRLSTPSTAMNGFSTLQLDSTAVLEQTFDLPVRLLAPHVLTGQDTLTVSRGPIIYTVEAADNAEIEPTYPHFEGVGISSNSTFSEREIKVLGFKAVQLVATQPALGVAGINRPEAYREVGADSPARQYKKLGGLIFTPWFVRGNRGGSGHIRTSLVRVDEVL